MQLYSTKNKNLRVNLEEAVFKGLPTDGGLYLPLSIPKLDDTFFKNIHSYSLNEIAFYVSQALIGDEIHEKDLKLIIDQAITFDAPIVQVEENIYSLELFHGPSLAFKDFGARFMAALMSYYLNRKNSQPINILVATSGDTGSAVGSGFLNMKNIKVTILYPSKKISNIQEKQLTTLGNNVTALEVEGTFDDCQRMVKQAFLDTELSQKLNLSSANSINISRLIPQSFYYFYAYAQLSQPQKPLIFSVPSGNFGNLCGGLIAKQMGLPVTKFIASTNINDVVPQYLDSGIFTPRASIQTIANAMDVGNPSNFDRLQELYSNDIEQIKNDIVGKIYTDNQIKAAIKSVANRQHGYILDPHGAIAYMGLIDYMVDSSNHSNIKDANGIFLETAHPAKFYTDVENILGRKISIPDSLIDVMQKTKTSINIKANLNALKEFLMH
ncbi:MAG: threonine synthase [Pseudomonadota bacterium]|nr:threonine synthase [Pseudomonadota bacterium]